MKKTVVVTVLAVWLGFPVTSLFQNLKADEWDQKTTLTFDKPVEVPGKVLPAGTYVFKLADSQSNRRVVQVFSADEKHLYATILGIAKDRSEPTDKTIITFEETSTGGPEAVKAWFYPGEISGIQFVYHKQRAIQLASNTNESVPAMTSETMASQPAQPVPAAPEPATPENTSSQVAALKEEPVETVVPPQAETQTQAPTDQVATAQAVELPKTASELPLLVLLSGASLFGIFLIRYALKHTS